MKIDVLDHGFVRLVESWGGGDNQFMISKDWPTGPEKESGIIEAARQSTQGSFRGWEKDEKLLKYLFENKHDTPFEFAGMVIEVKAPLFVFREWHRHRTQCLSGDTMIDCYAPLPNENYVPTVERLMMSNDKNKQAGSVKDSAFLTELEAERFQHFLRVMYEEFDDLYQNSLDKGVPKELSRIGMPVGRYSQMRATANLRNWLGFLTLRMDPHAQWEIRQYANAVAKIIKQEFPKTYSLFKEGKNQ